MTRAPGASMVVGLALLLGTSWSAAEQISLDEDEIGLLYSSQVQFGPQGIPLVTIGLMEEQASVFVSSPAGLVLTGRGQVDGQSVEKSIRAPARSRWRLEVEDTIPAQVSYWCGVESMPFAGRSSLQAAIDRWTERGEAVQVFEVGSVFGIRGHVIDNRTYLLGVRSFSSEAEASRAAQEIFTKYGSRTFVHAHLDRRPSGRIRVFDERGARVETFLDLVRIEPSGPGEVTVHKVEFAKGYRWHGFQDRQYAGSILVTPDRRNGLVVVNRVPVDRLLEGLVPAEIFPTAPVDALKAQAVVARGEVFAKIGSRHFLDPYLLCASTHCQVYSGVGVEHHRTSRAVRATRGELLFLGPELVDSVYSACCGGHSEDNDAVWSDPPSAALRGRPDMPPDGRRRWQNVSERLESWLDAEPKAFCQLSSFSRKGLFRWARTISSQEMDRLVAKSKPIGHVVSIQILGRGVSGRVKVVRVVGTEGDLVVQREWPIRQLLGLLKSGMFIVSPVTDADQLVTGFHFRGGGWGHGVGLCQIGATGMAERGYDYRHILGHYYGGADVFRLYGPRAGEPVDRPVQFIGLPAKASP